MSTSENQDSAHSDASSTEGVSSNPAPSDESACAAEPTKPSEKPAAPSARPAQKPARRAAGPAAPPKGGFGKSVLLFVFIVGGLAAAFALLGREEGGGAPPSAPKWNVGQVVDVEITLVASDARDLRCAGADEIAGRHCAFESTTKPWSKTSDNNDDKKLLRPYTTVDRVQFVAAGLWSDPALKAQLPSARFSVKCKYTIEGKMKRPSISWAADGPWYDQNNDWYSGSVSNCTVVSP